MDKMRTFVEKYGLQDYEYELREMMIDHANDCIDEYECPDCKHLESAYRDLEIKVDNMLDEAHHHMHGGLSYENCFESPCRDWDLQT